MRLSALCLLAAATIALGACAKNASQQSSTATEAPAAGSAVATSAPGGTTATMTQLPEYPGATKMASGASGMAAGGGSAAGTVLSTTDPFAKVYKWYQGKMPAGSEKSHMTTPMGETAVFTMGEMGKDQQSVTLTVTAGKTMITLAHVKR